MNIEEIQAKLSASLDRNSEQKIAGKGWRVVFWRVNDFWIISTTVVDLDGIEQKLMTTEDEPILALAWIVRFIEEREEDERTGKPAIYPPPAKAVQLELQRFEELSNLPAPAPAGGQAQGVQGGGVGTIKMGQYATHLNGDGYSRWDRPTDGNAALQAICRDGTVSLVEWMDRLNRA